MKAVLFLLPCMCLAQDLPPLPPGWTPTNPYKVLRSPKDASVQTVTMARAYVVLPSITISNTCSIQFSLAGQDNGTNVYAWTVTANTGSGVWYLETSTNLVQWTPVMCWSEFCNLMPDTQISVAGYFYDGDKNEKRRYFRNRTE